MAFDPLADLLGYGADQSAEDRDAGVARQQDEDQAMKLKRTGKFWLVVAGPLALPIGAALIVFGLSSAGEYAAHSDDTPSHATAYNQLPAPPSLAEPESRAAGT